jgi:hypothetical protein
MTLRALIHTERNQGFIYSLIMGTAIFVYVTGGAIINPTKRDWLMLGDSAQHYLGWEFFRNTPLWQWPIGANYPLGMELSSSIVFTDSIPIAAFIAKLLNPVLPSTFQYLGIWIWLCFVLQAYFAQRFLKFFTSNRTQVYLATCFIILSPPLIYRLVHAGHGHIALASHWLILASLYLYLRPGKSDLNWSLLIALCWMIQAYFAPMIAAVWLSHLVKRFYVDRKQFAIFKSIGFIAIASFLAMWASGYFMIGSNFNPEGWNYVFRWQPLSLVDSGTEGSTGWSHILEDRGQLSGENEAFSFLGVGVIMIMVISLAKIINSAYGKKLLVPLSILSGSFLFLISVTQMISISKLLSATALLIVIAFVGITLFKHLAASGSGRTYLPLFIAVALLALYSMTNSVGFAQRTLFTYPLFPPLSQFTETFRTHGRSIWPAYYVLILGSVVYIIRNFKAKIAITVLAVSLAVQFLETIPAINSARSRFVNETIWVSPLKDPRWLDLAANYKNIVVVPPLNNDPDQLWIAIDDFAARNRLNTNSGYFSRFDSNTLRTYSEQLSRELRDGTADQNSIYIVNDPLLETFFKSNPNSSFTPFRLDNFLVIAP